MRKARPAAVITLASLLVGQCLVFAGATPFSGVVVFGDSMSDTGNLYRMDGGIYPPSPPYWEGRFCDGSIWVEYLAKDFGMAGLLDDYAVGGAATGHANSGVPAFGGVHDQIQSYFSSHDECDPNALYIIWAGHNDILIALALGESPETVIGKGIMNTLLSIQTLWDAGARQILIATVSDLGLTPAIRQMGPEVSGPLSALCAAYNQALKAALADLTTSGKPTILWDALASQQAVLNSPAEFGFTDVTDPYLPVGLQAGDDPAQYLYWDDAHPTTHAHRVLADAARNCLIDYYSPRNGRAMPPALVNALNGLVRAGKGK